MWRTPECERVLRGAESKLFARGVLRLLEELGEKGDNDKASAKAFYRLPRSQQVVVLSQVVDAVFRASVEAPEHTQINEAAIAAVFDAFSWLISEEIDEDDGCNGGPIRELVRRVTWRELPGTDVPWVGDADPEVWRNALEPIIDLILWDRDFEDDPDPTLNPEQSAALQQFARILPTYYSATVAETPEAVASLLEDRIRAMCESII